MYRSFINVRNISNVNNYNIYIYILILKIFYKILISFVFLTIFLIKNELIRVCI